MAEAVVDIFELVEVGEDDRRAFGMALEARDALMDRGQEIAAVEQRGQRVALRHALELGDRDLEHAILAAQRIAFAAQRAELVLDRFDGRKADLIDRDPCPPDAVHSTSPMRTQTAAGPTPTVCLAIADPTKLGRATCRVRGGHG